jgi:hypothetical protein
MSYLLNYLNEGSISVESYQVHTIDKQMSVVSLTFTDDRTITIAEGMLVSYKGGYYAPLVHGSEEFLVIKKLLKSRYKL